MLEISVYTLIDREAAKRAAACVDDVEVQAIREALGRYPCLSAGQGKPVSVQAVQRQAAYLDHVWLASRFAVVARYLPGLMDDAQAAVLSAPEVELVDAYRVTSSQQGTEAIATLLNMADRMRGEVDTDEAHLLALYGMLYLAASITAAEQEDAALALYEAGHALEFAATIDPAAVAALSAERRANYLLDLTEAHSRTGDYRQAAQCESARLVRDMAARAGVTA